MKAKLSAGAAVLTIACAASFTMVPVGAAPPATIVVVSNANDDGPGSFRRAVRAANENAAIERIQFLGGLPTIFLRQKVEFWGSQGLTISSPFGYRRPAGSTGRILCEQNRGVRLLC